MQYHKKIIVNNSNDDWMFYEWEKKDSYEILENVLVIKVSNEVMSDIINNHIRVNEFTNRWVLFVSFVGAIVLKLDNYGKEIKRSRLLLEDEMDVIKCFKNSKELDIEYEVLGKVLASEVVRKCMEDKTTINGELERIIMDKDLEKAKYLYYEWFGKVEDDFDVMMKKMSSNLDNSDSVRKISNILKVFSK